MLTQKKSSILNVLVYGAQLSEHYGSGIYTINLLSQWNSSEISTLSKTKYKHILSDNQHYTLYRKKHTRRIAEETSIVRGGNQSEKNEHELVRKLYTRLKNSIGQLYRSMGGAEILPRVALGGELKTWILSKQPNVIYGVCSNYRSVKTLIRISQYISVPLVVHVMDDWPMTLYNSGFAKYIIRPRYVQVYRKLIEKSDVVIGICEEMAQEYQQRYKRNIISYPIPVALDEYWEVFRSQWSAGKPFTIRYGGRVGWAIRKSLEDVAFAVHQLSKEGYNIVFQIATNQVNKVPAVCNDLDCVSVSKLAPLEELPRIASECDLHLICYDFDRLAVKQARFSMPGKLPACMASGTPILVYASPCLPVVKYAQKHQWGSLVTVRDEKTLVDRIRELIENESLREALGTKAREIAFARHDAKVVSAEFREMMADLVEKHRQSRGSLNEN